MNLRSAISLLVLFSCFVLAGQPHDFRHYQVEQGLSNNAVICCVQDYRGFLWFGTKDGLDRFDGYTFKVFRNNPEDSNSIGSNFIHALYLDKNKHLWVGTDKGLYRYDEIHESFTLLPTPAAQQVTAISMDQEENLWFISNFTLYKYSVATGVLTPFPIASHFEATSVCTLKDGSVWVSSANGYIHRYNNHTNQFAAFNLFSHSPPTVSSWIETLYPVSDGSLLAGTSNQGVKQFFPSTASYKDILTYTADKTEIFARAFVQTDSSECWIATETGIYIYNLLTGQSVNLRKEYHNPYSISDNAVYSFCKDREGGIWATTYFGGVNYYPRQPVIFQKYFPSKEKNTIAGNVVREVAEDKNGNLWIGTEDAGLHKLNPATGLFKHFMPGGSTHNISYTNIHGLLAADNELWIGTFEHGLDVMSLSSEKVIRHYAKGPGPNDLKSNFIYCLYRSARGEIMIGTTIGAYQYNRATDNFSLLPGMPLHNWYSSLLKDKEGIIWAGTYGNGANFYNTNTRQAGNFRYQPGNKNSISSDRVNDLFEDSRNIVWFATEDGLCKYLPQTRSFKRYTTAEGLPANFILSLAEDENHLLWISTTKGLASFNPVTENITVYTKANGLLNDQFNFSSAFRDSRGQLYFGSGKGLIRFHPGSVRPAAFAPPVFITGFQVNNTELAINRPGSPLQQSVSLTNKIVLSHRQSTFSIDFASLSYTAPEMSEYAYKMEGLSEEWTYLKTNRKVYFTNLAPGKYVFRVKAAGTAANNREASLIILVQPPWWASNLAYALYGVAALLLTLFIIRFYHLRIREKNRRKIEQLERTKEKELYEAKMQFFTNVAHEIKTPLTLIKGPLENVMKKAGEQADIKNSLHIMDKNTDRLVDLTNQLLDFRQTEINGFSLNFTRENITEITEEIYNSFKPLAEKKGLQFNLHVLVPQLQASVDTDAFNKILTNLLSNAVKYASQTVDLALQAEETGSTFTIEVKNDGHLIPGDMKEKVFEPFFRLKETEKQKGTGIGLALSRSLTLLHGGTLVLEEPDSHMNRFVLTLPLQQHNQQTS